MRHLVMTAAGGYRPADAAAESQPSSPVKALRIEMLADAEAEAASAGLLPDTLRRYSRAAASQPEADMADADVQHAAWASLTDASAVGAASADDAAAAEPVATLSRGKRAHATVGQATAGGAAQTSSSEQDAAAQADALETVRLLEARCGLTVARDCCCRTVAQRPTCPCA